ncbi:MAG: hypothetical protein IPN17_00590 [Deltaproteobacteria bacterium]|nr:hypothetical protein [Deltaproteobacteria bacterium]
MKADAARETRRALHMLVADGVCGCRDDGGTPEFVATAATADEVLPLGAIGDYLSRLAVSRG